MCQVARVEPWPLALRAALDGDRDRDIGVMGVGDQRINAPGEASSDR